MVTGNPMFQPIDRRSVTLATRNSMANELRTKVCKGCGDATVLAVTSAVAEAERENKNLQIQLLDLESDALFEFNNLQDELLETRDVVRSLQTQLEETEEKRIQDQRLKTELEQQVLQMSEEILSLRLALAKQSSPPSEEDVQTAKPMICSRASSAEQPDTPNKEETMRRALSLQEEDRPHYQTLDEVLMQGVCEETKLETALASMSREYQALTQDVLVKRQELSQQLAAASIQMKEAQRLSNSLPKSAAHCRPWPVRCHTVHQAITEV